MFPDMGYRSYVHINEQSERARLLGVDNEDQQPLRVSPMSMVRVQQEVVRDLDDLLTCRSHCEECQDLLCCCCPEIFLKTCNKAISVCFPGSNASRSSGGTGNDCTAN